MSLAPGVRLGAYEIVAYDGSPFLVSELLEGQTLRERLATSPLPARKALCDS